MWLLVRAGSLDGYWKDEQGLRTLAACPDTDERGDPWLWSATLDERTDESTVLIEADPEFISATTRIHDNGHSSVLERAAGTQTVIAALAGQVLVAAVDGPWERWLEPGDVFIVEGEEDEVLRISLDGPAARASVTTLVPRQAAALRWVP